MGMSLPVILPVESQCVWSTAKVSEEEGGGSGQSLPVFFLAWHAQPSIPQKEAKEMLAGNRGVKWGGRGKVPIIRRQMERTVECVRYYGHCGVRGHPVPSDPVDATGNGNICILSN